MDKIYKNIDKICKNIENMCKNIDKKYHRQIDIRMLKKPVLEIPDLTEISIAVYEVYYTSLSAERFSTFQVQVLAFFNTIRPDSSPIKLTFHPRKDFHHCTFFYSANIPTLGLEIPPRGDTFRHFENH